MNAVNVVVAKDAVDVTNTKDEWYRKRYKEKISKPEKYTQWKVLDGQLYFLKPKPVVSKIVEDLNYWKLVLPKKLRIEALRELHDTSQAGHLGIKKIYQQIIVNCF